MNSFFASLALVAVFVAAALGFYAATGTHGFGLVRPGIEVTVLGKHVDVSHDSDNGSNTHYMVATSNGTYEVQNGFVLGVWNADEIFGSMREGHTYVITTKGNRMVGMFMQKYPYIIAAVEKK